MPRVEKYRVTKADIAGVPVLFTTYKIGDTYHCVVANESPGANLVRTSGTTEDEALVAATEKARRLLRGA